MNIPVKLFILIVFSFIEEKALAQNINTTTEIKTELSLEIKYVDVNKDEKISQDEADVIFNQYFSNKAREQQTELTEDIEATVIDLISYLETISCNDLKKTKGSKGFIELYYINKFNSTVTN